MESTVKQRLMDFIKKEGISVRQFERACGFANGYVSNVISSISSDKYSKILSAFPKINPDWLLRGEGNMYVGEISNNTVTNSPHAHFGNIQNASEAELIELLKMQGEQLTIALRTIEKLTK